VTTPRDHGDPPGAQFLADVLVTGAGRLLGDDEHRSSTVLERTA
jgi:hypothetical protein